MLVLHDLAFCQPLRNRVLMLYGDGRHAAGAAELLQPERLEDLYGCRVRASWQRAGCALPPRYIIATQQMERTHRMACRSICLTGGFSIR